MKNANATWVSRCCGAVEHDSVAREWGTCPECREAATFVLQSEFVPKPESDVDQVNMLIGTLATV